MRRRSLTELANNPDLISGIYNYCDRWCERCPLTSRCLVYATEQEEEVGSPESHDIRMIFEHFTDDEYLLSAVVGPPRSANSFAGDEVGYIGKISVGQ